MKLRSHSILFLSFLFSDPGFPISGQMSQKNREKKNLTFFKATKVVAGLGVACVTCGCVVISGNRCLCAL